jgi:outer membrane receptor protein involved in Fe transport
MEGETIVKRLSFVQRTNVLNHCKKIIGIVLGGLSLSVSAHAFQPDAYSTVYRIDEARIAQAGYTDLSDILRDIPGMVAVRNGYYLSGGQRGLNGRMEQTMLLVDGREMQSLNQVQSFISRQFPVQNILRVEVYQGASGVGFGANAAAGVINIVTKTGAKEFDTSQVSGALGTESLAELGAVLTKKDGDFRLSASVRPMLTRDWNFSDFVQDSTRFSGGMSELAAGPIDDSHRYLNTTEGVPFSIRASWKDFYAGYDGYYMNTHKGIWSVQLNYQNQLEHRQLETVFLGWEKEFENKLHAKVEYQRWNEKYWGIDNRFNQEMFDNLVAGTLPPPFAEQDSRGSDTDPLTDEEVYRYFTTYYSQELSPGSVRDRVDATVSKTWEGDLQLNGGIRVERNDLLGEQVVMNQLAPSFDETASANNPARRDFYAFNRYSAYLEGSKAFQIGEGRLSVLGGARYDYQTLVKGIAVFQAATVYRPSTDWDFRVAYKQGYREPTIFDYGGAGETADINLGLKPSRVDDLELGIARRFSEDARASLTVFQTTYSNTLVQTAPMAGPTPSQAVNDSDRTIVRGVETSGDYQFNSWLGSNLGYVFNTRADSQGGPAGLYPHRVFLGFTASPWERMNFNLKLNWFSPIEAQSGNSEAGGRVDLPSFYTADAAVSTSGILHPALKISGVVTNLLNQSYSQPNFLGSGPREFLQPGRQFVVRASLDF